MKQELSREELFMLGDLANDHADAFDYDGEYADKYMALRDKVYEIAGQMKGVDDATT